MGRKRPTILNVAPVTLISAPTREEDDSGDDDIMNLFLMILSRLGANSIMLEMLSIESMR